MSWEEMWTYKTTCPCGKGYITQKCYGDDWNRFKDGPVTIECKECNQKFKVEEIIHHRLRVSDEDWSEYFLLPKNYPEYDGPSVSKTYGSGADPYRDFTGWLIENFTEDELRKVEEQLHVIKASSRLTGDAAYICKRHKEVLKTVKVSSILASVEKADIAYSNYVGNKLQREIIRKQEEDTRTVYDNKKAKYRVKIKLRE